MDHIAVVDAHTIVDMWRNVFALDADLTALAIEVYLYCLRNPEARKRSLVQRRKNAEMVAEFMEARAAANGMSLLLPAKMLADIFLITSDGFAQAALIDPDAVDAYEKFLEIMIPLVMHDA
jgi:hypothetical protein